MTGALWFIRALWLIELGCESIALVKLWDASLWRRLPCFTAYLAVDILTAIILVWIDVGDSLYPRAYLWTQWLTTISLITVGVESFLLWLGPKSMVRGGIAANVTLLAALSSLLRVSQNFSLGVLAITRLAIGAAIIGGLMASCLLVRLTTRAWPQMSGYLSWHLCVLTFYLIGIDLGYLAILYFPWGRMPLWDCLMMIWAAGCFLAWFRIRPAPRD